ncbi:solute carrier family 35 member F5 [Hetaerina americana]|uniref:solute carrier family 35 member F5 n=1 Tax=Hetaerina americana TaxID=62018 RepID=UPI003A7F3482
MTVLVEFRVAPTTGMLSKSQRFVLGLFVLLLVDIIWVASSELTKYIYHNENFEKPFFSTYLKNSMFSLYLLGFIVWPPWRDHCGNSRNPTTYMSIDPNSDDENFYTEANTSLSDPTFVPIKSPALIPTLAANEKESSGADDSDDSSVRSVRFSKLAEVRHMSERDAREALLARLSHGASLRAGEAARRAAGKLCPLQVARLAVTFSIIWFCANYTYQVALMETEAGVVTVLSSTASLFTLGLAAIFPSAASDRFSFAKLAAVCISICGVVVISLSDLKTGMKVPMGAIMALFSAFLYAAYLVFLRRKVDNEDKMDIPMFFGFIGLFNFLLLWPMFFILHHLHYEPFEWPSRHQWAFLLANGIIGTLLSEVLWLWGCFLTSSLTATNALLLTIPLSTLSDVALKGVKFPLSFYLGCIPVLLAFIAVSLLSLNSNTAIVSPSQNSNLDQESGIKSVPFKRRCLSILNCLGTGGIHGDRGIGRRTLRSQECDAEQSESLIGINSGDHEA